MADATAMWNTVVREMNANVPLCLRGRARTIGRGWCNRTGVVTTVCDVLPDTEIEAMQRQPAAPFVECGDVVIQRIVRQTGSQSCIPSDEGEHGVVSTATL